jgi:hypothetical protein
LSTLRSRVIDAEADTSVRKTSWAPRPRPPRLRLRRARIWLRRRMTDSGVHLRPLPPPPPRPAAAWSTHPRTLTTNAARCPPALRPAKARTTSPHRFRPSTPGPDRVPHRALRSPPAPDRHHRARTAGPGTRERIRRLTRSLPLAPLDMAALEPETPVATTANRASGSAPRGVILGRTLALEQFACRRRGRLERAH